MHTPLTKLLDRLDSPDVLNSSVITWGCPVPSFGSLSTSRVATLGLNPSNREFVDKVGDELHGASRRFHTLSSLGIQSWTDIDARHLNLIIRSCDEYFCRNPYDQWFKKLDYILSGTGTSYYSPNPTACHLDLIPYATECKWTALSRKQRADLKAVSGDTLATLLRDSPVCILILNGKAVIDQFQDMADVRLDEVEMADWTLPRRHSEGVTGFAYHGVLHRMSGTALHRTVKVLGFNHNLQSSFGVTTKVMKAIQDWVAQAALEVSP